MEQLFKVGILRLFGLKHLFSVMYTDTRVLRITRELVEVLTYLYVSLRHEAIGQLDGTGIP